MTDECEHCRMDHTSVDNWLTRACDEAYPKSPGDSVADLTDAIGGWAYEIKVGDTIRVLSTSNHVTSPLTVRKVDHVEPEFSGGRAVAFVARNHGTNQDEHFALSKHTAIYLLGRAHEWAAIELLRGN